MTSVSPAVPLTPADYETLERIQRRVLWLAVRMVDHANRERPNAGGIKVGGHQASSASISSIMTALWFGHLTDADRLAVKPHASPVFHAISYLTGVLDREWLTKLRQIGGLQAYPSRTKDPDVAHFSTGSVGLGAVAPLFAATTRRYVEAHFGARPLGANGRPARFVALVGDAELDEGNVWEAIADPVSEGLGNVHWIVDLNRQSLDRVIPGMKALRLMKFFADSGWNVIEAKYGRRLQAAFQRPGGDSLRRHIDDTSNEEYQSWFAFHGAPLRQRVLEHSDASVKAFLDGYCDEELAPLVQNLGGHDIGELISAYRACDAVTDRPSVVFAYTIKGYGLPIAGDPLNHAALLSPSQVDALRDELGLDATTEWDRFAPDSAESRLCARAATVTSAAATTPRVRPVLPSAVGVPTAAATSTQETFGRILTSLGNVPGVAERIVTTSPDVSVSTNLGGWVNKMGVFHPVAQPDFLGDQRVLRWKQGPSGHHLELGISEMNLFLLLGQLGLSHELHGETLLPIGTVYDPFVCRGLDALIYALYNGARFVVVGTPSGISLAPEGGAHQSTITASIGMELPGITLVEPAFATALDWLLCDGLHRLTLDAADGGSSLYLRLSTRPLDQSPFEDRRRAVGDDALRRDVLAGAYRLVEPDPSACFDAPLVHLMACGAVVPEAIAAAALLADEGVAASVIDVTSLDRLYSGWRGSLLRAARGATHAPDDHHFGRLLPAAQRAAPIVTIHDAASHAMAWVGSVFGQRVLPVGVDGFGQSGTIDELYEAFDLRPDQIVAAALVALDG